MANTIRRKNLEKKSKTTPHEKIHSTQATSIKLQQVDMQQRLITLLHTTTHLLNNMIFLVTLFKVLHPS